MIQHNLSQIALDTAVQISGFNSAPEIAQRLVNLGLFPGAVVTPVHVNKTGMILARGFDRIAVANSIANQINVIHL